MTTQAQINATARYDRLNTVQIHLKLNKKTDADIIAALEGAGNMQGYIKELIRASIKGQS